ncbi:FAD:protein FMN transferase [Pseudoflavonifractor phocaeensis]|uniref:FAD:protein FMN transferase n=1 Tax=Pseudoflavonifractor phocaeensis TaxID=1870988 RepID=UPI001959942A|nr:FAD:protein FMN transferase [Pseudoflavonifractor phocaeensis]MBM6723611.1 FAD:protein FMN transferase [Pseudoflavonifractor phocaeensis]
MKRLISFLLAPLFFLLPGCGAQEAEEQFFSMDTVMSIHVYGSGAAEAAAAARREVEALDSQLSRTRADSLISQLNAHAGDGTDVALDADTARLLAFSKSISQLLPGDFDITIAPVMDAWGFTGEDRHVPDSETLSAAMALVGSEGLSVDESAGTARLERAGMAVDLGAVAKGYAAAKAEEALREAGITSALLDLGRNITAIGPKTDGTAWRVGVADPENDSQYLCILSLEDQTASTSGGYERYFEENGVRYHHIIDPETGYPADSGLKSVTVISADHLLADALSTALFVAGPEEALEFWRSRDDFELVLCTGENQLLVTEGLEAGFTFTGEELGYDCQIIRR